MPAIEFITFATVGTSIEKTNIVIGQIKAVLIQDPNVTIISDNDPLGLVNRFLEYEVGEGGHRIRLTSSTTNATYIYLQVVTSGNIAVLQTLTSSISVGISMRFYYSANLHVLCMGSTNICVTVKLSAGWYTGATSTGNLLLYFDGSDAAYSTSFPYHPYLKDGKFMGLTAYLYNDPSGLIEIIPNMWRANVNVLPDGTYVSAGVKYHVFNDWVITGVD